MTGIIDFAVTFPESRISVKQLHELSGVSMAELREVTHCEEFPVLGEYEQAWELAAEAASAVLDRAGVPPEEIGQVIYAGSGHWDSPIWSPAAKVADELGILDAHCFEITNGCNGGTTALRAGADAIAAGRTSHVLVLMGDRLSDMVDYRDADSKALMNFGDASAAILLGAGPGAFEIVHCAMRTDPGWSDYYSGEYVEFGAVVRRRGRRKGLREAYVRTFAELVSRTLDALEASTEDIAALLINQSDRGMHEAVLAEIGLPAERSVFNYDRLAHMGGADPLIALQDLLGEGRLRPGDLVLLATSGRGFSWGITALRCRR